jgi:hypothetical protein
VHGKNDFQLRGFFIPQHYAEEVVVHDLLDAVGDAAKKLVAIQNGRDFLADLGKQREALAHRGMAWTIVLLAGLRGGLFARASSDPWLSFSL